MNLVFALVTGLASAIIYSVIQEVFLYFRWIKTRRFLLSEISSKILTLSTSILDILDINPIYDNGLETDHLMSNEEFISKIETLDIDCQQYEQINNAFTNISNKIKNARKEALVIPTFSSKDFHLVDRIIMKIGDFTSSYYWLHDEIENSENDAVENKEINNDLKRKLIDIIKTAKEKIFTNNYLDRIIKWKNRRKYQKHKK